MSQAITPFNFLSGDNFSSKVFSRYHQFITCQGHISKVD